MLPQKVHGCLPGDGMLLCLVPHAKEGKRTGNQSISQPIEHTSNTSVSEYPQRVTSTKRRRTCIHTQITHKALAREHSACACASWLVRMEHERTSSKLLGPYDGLPDAAVSESPQCGPLGPPEATEALLLRRIVRERAEVDEAVAGALVEVDADDDGGREELDDARLMTASFACHWYDGGG